MSKINKLITNKPVTLTEEEVTNLSKTLSAVQTAGGGGGGGGRVYYGDDVTISVNQTDGIISLTTDATEKLNTPIPTKVSDLTDSANYATNQYVQVASAEVTGWVNNQNYLTQVPDTYYLKTETSGKDEISDAFSNIPAYILTGDSNITATSAQDGKNVKWNLSINAPPTVTDTTLTGERGIYTHTTDVSGQWCVELVQSAYDAINDVSNKLDSSDFTTYTGTTAPNTYLTKTSADTLYQPTGNYITTADVLTGTDNILTGIKIGSTNYTIPTTDLSNYYTKTQVDSTFASASQLNGYLTTAQYETDSATFVTSSSDTITGTKQYALTTAGWMEVSTSTIPDITANNGISADGYKIGLTESVYSAIQEISAANDLVGANGISVVTGLNNQIIIEPSGINPAKQYAMTTTGWAEIQAGTTETAYVPLSGGTMSGQLTISGSNFDNNLHLKRGNNEGFIGLAGNGAITFKNSVNGSTSQIEFLTSDSKTFDITVKDNSSTPQPVGKLYVMSAHSLADASATSANWANDGMLHIILDS